jgi:hypothetical protein
MKIDFAPAEKFRGTQIFRQANNLAYAYETTFKAVDADGAPNAYNPGDTGLDALANAGYPHTNWWKDVLVPDPDHPSKAYVQTDGEFAGYFVAMSSLRNPHGEAIDPCRRWRESVTSVLRPISIPGSRRPSSLPTPAVAATQNWEKDRSPCLSRWEGKIRIREPAQAFPSEKFST